TASKGGASKLARPALKFQRPIHPRPPTTTSGTAPEATFFQLLYRGVFTSVRSAAIPRPGPYTGQRLAASSPSRFSSPPRPPRRQHARSPGFGPQPRPTVYPRETSHVGLGAARTFSSSGFAVFDNVVHNAPFALRALADQYNRRDGDVRLDEHKWRRVRREIRKRERTDVRGKGAIDRQTLKENVAQEFAQYFPASSSSSSTASRARHADAGAVGQEREREPVSIVFVLDPEIHFASSRTTTTMTSGGFDPSTYRLLPRDSVTATLETFTEQYALHANRLRQVIDRLSAAGLFDTAALVEESINVDVATGKRRCHVTFHDGFLTRSRLESIVRGGARPRSSLSQGGGRRSTGEGIWWWIEGGRQEPVEPLSSSPMRSVSPHASFDSPLLSSMLSSSSGSFDPSETLVLPDPSFFSFSDNDLSSSLSSPSPLSPSLEPIAELWSSPSPSRSSSSLSSLVDHGEENIRFFDEPDYDDDEMIDLDDDAISSFESMRDFEAIESWSRTTTTTTTSGIEQEQEQAGTREFVSFESDSRLRQPRRRSEEGEDDGVREFLRDVELERERVGSTWRR
ncbi:hypothetical protein JCM3766R1_002787, partial [Sporobolomyces carnicolor]